MIIEHFLSWPLDTGVTGSFIAAIILGVPAFVKSSRASKKRHNERLQQNDIHHESLKQHITETLAQSDNSVRTGHTGNLAEPLDTGSVIG